MQTLTLTLRYWKDGDWFVGEVIEVPGVMSQGETLESLKANIEDAYKLVVSTRKRILSRQRRRAKSTSILVHA
jgi:predicted RNase H-like HicB family nuclease